MENYFKRKSANDRAPPTLESCKNDQAPSTLKKSRVAVDFENLPADPGLRCPISSYHPMDRDEIRRMYLQKGPCQPHDHKFPYTQFGQQKRRFNATWFKDYGSWMEYNIEKDVFCICCYLSGDQARSDAFITEGYKNWKKKERFADHVGGPNSAHNQAYEKCQNLLNQKQHIETVIEKQSDQARREYRIRLKATLSSIGFLLRQGLPFRGHEESEDSNNMGNFLECLKFLADHNKTIKGVVLENAPENLKLTSPKIQKDIANAAAIETAQAIIYELGDAPFALLVDESRDISMKEQMAVVLRYVDKRGCVIERFLAIEYVTNTTAQSLKVAIEVIFSKHGLSITSLRGQGYDGASNMQGKLNGLKMLIQNANPAAFYVHCFAHQLQLTLVAVAKIHEPICIFFELVFNLLNCIGSSCKRHDMIQNIQAAGVIDALNSGELESGQGLNQETRLKRPGDTCWGSHYGSLVNLIHMLSSVVDVLGIILKDHSSEQRGCAGYLLTQLESFDFVFKMHMMKNILAITSELSKALQGKDQDIVNAMELVRIAKHQFQMMRNDGWDSLLSQVHQFCNKHEISTLNMDDLFVERQRSRRKGELTNLCYYRFDIFYTVIDLQLRELNSRFDEVNTELLLCVAYLDPNNSFSAFKKEQLIRLSQFYPDNFSNADQMILDNQLDTYIVDMRTNRKFLEVKGMSGLAQKMIETKKDIVYPLVYLLLNLALTLPIVTATVERVFSAMKIVKNRLRNRMEDEWMNDCLLVYIEKDIFNSIDDEKIMQRFQNMKNRRGQL